jgi:hypothetical protein
MYREAASVPSGAAAGHSPWPPRGKGADPVAAPQSLPDNRSLVARFGPRVRAELAEALGLPEATLTQLPGLGYLPDDPHGACFTFPEEDGAGRLVGIVRRYADGRKRAMPGSRRGLTVPAGWRERPGPVFLPEGASDVLALTALGLAGVGRPAASGGLDFLTELLRTLPQDRPLIVLGENDRKPDGTWPGRVGANRTAESLARRLGRPVAWTLPPDEAKDARAWVLAQHLPLEIADAWQDAGERLLAALVDAAETRSLADATAIGDPSTAHAAGCRAPASGDAAVAVLPWEPPVPLTELPPAPPFPVEVFPAALVRFVDEVAAALGCPKDFVALPVLVLAGAALGASRALEVKPGWWERPALYAAVVGRPGTAKSPALKAAAAPIYALQQRLKATYDQAAAVHEEKLAEYELHSRRRKDVIDVYAPGPGRPVPPILQSLYCADATVESLAPLLRDNPRGLIVLRDELSAFVTGMNQYKAGKGSDRQFYLAAWAGEPVRVDRRQQPGGPLLVPHPFLAVVGSVPPDVLGGFQNRQRVADGFLDRFLFAYPEPGRLAEWTATAPSPEATTAWRNLVDRLVGLAMEPDPEGGLRPYRVRLTDCGRHAWEDFGRALAAEVNEPDFPDHLVGPWSKLKGYGARLALIVQFLRWAADETPEQDVDGESVRRAVQLVRYFQDQARKVYAAVNADPVAAGARQLLAWFERHADVRCFSRRLMHQGVRGSTQFAQARALDLPLMVLERHNYVRQLPAADWHGRGRKPTDQFEVNPLWNRTHDE